LVWASGKVGTDGGTDARGAWAAPTALGIL